MCSIIIKINKATHADQTKGQTYKTSKWMPPYKIGHDKLTSIGQEIIIVFAQDVCGPGTTAVDTQ